MTCSHQQHSGGVFFARRWGQAAGRSPRPSWSSSSEGQAGPGVPTPSTWKRPQIHCFDPHPVFHVVPKRSWGGGYRAPDLPEREAQGED